MAPTKKTTKSDVSPVSCTVEGLYFAATSEGKQMLKPYSLTASIPRKYAHQALPVFKKAYLKDSPISGKKSLLRENYPDAISVHTHELVSVVFEDDGYTPKTVDIMSEEQLSQYIEENGIDIKRELYPTLQDLRVALKEWEADEESFYANQEIRYERLAPDLEFQAAFEAMPTTTGGNTDGAEELVNDSSKSTKKKTSKKGNAGAGTGNGDDDVADESADEFADDSHADPASEV